VQTYFAKSILASKTFWFNFAALVLALAEAKEFIDVLPAGALKYVPAVVSVVNILLRLGSVRPVAMIAPSETKPIPVKSI